jgi:RNA polymerase sigma-70 factor (ECF subfamily)
VLAVNPAFVDIGISDAPNLLELAQAGDAEAFGEICRRHETRLLRQALTLCGNATLAEDLAQDTLVEAWKSLRRYNGRCHFFTWLCAILLNRYRNTIREQRPVPFSSLASRDRDECEGSVANLVDQGSLPDEAAQIREQTARILECLEALPPKHQQVIYLRFFVDDSLVGIADALGCSLGTVKSRLFHALEKLRGMIALRVEPSETKTKAGIL